MRIRTFFLALLFVSLAAVAQDRRYYVNLETLFDSYYKTLAANVSFEDRKQQVEDQHALIRKELEALAADAKKHEADFRNELLAKEARENAARKLQAVIERIRLKRTEYERTRADNYQTLQRIRVEREDELVKEILKVVDAVANEKGATEVVEVSGKTMNRVVVFLRYPKNRELTAEILTRLNKGHERELKASKAELDKRKAKEAAAAKAANK